MDNEVINVKNLTVTAEQLNYLFPYLIVLVGSCVSLLAGVLRSSSDPNLNRQKRNSLSFFSTFVFLIVAVFSITTIWGEPGIVLFNGMMKIDYFSNLFNVIFIIATIMVILGSFSYLEKEEIHHAEFYSLIALSCLGMMLMASALDLISFFVSLEIMSIAAYVLVGFRRTDIRSNEAAIKYFILGSAVSAIMLYGMAMIYGSTGALNMEQIAKWVTTHPVNNPLFVLGAILVVVGFLFKVAIVPFHMWMPDVYEGAPTVVTNFMTTGIKAAAFAAFLRFYMNLNMGPDLNGVMAKLFHNVLWIVAFLTMFGGNILALAQTNIKRMLAYSSIAHSGYILIGLIVGKNSEYGYSSVVMYLITYIISNIGAFTIISMLSEKGNERTQVEDLSGIGFKKPMLGFAMAVFMLSMAGIPPTVGFAGKYLIFSSAAQAGELWLAVLGVLCSAISAYFYLRVIVYMYMREPNTDFTRFKFSPLVTLVVFVATFSAIQFGIFPSLIINAAKKAATLM